MERVKKYLELAGAIVAFCIGSGFATGQEILQFYAAYGPAGAAGALLLTAGVWLWLCRAVMEDGRRLGLEKAGEIWRWYAGERLGKALELFGLLFSFACLALMLSGAGAALGEYAGLPELWGRALMALLAVLAVLRGREELDSVNGALGLLIIAFTLLIGLGGLLRGGGDLVLAGAWLRGYPVLRAAKSWWLSGLLYPAFMSVLLLPFLAGLSQSCADERQAAAGGLLGGGAFLLCLGLMAFALLANLPLAGQAAIPTLTLARALSPWLGRLFGPALLLGIFSTVSALLWTCSSCLAGREGSPRFHAAAAALSLAAFACSAFPFDRLVNALYPATGYAGLLACLCVARRRFKEKRKQEKPVL